MHFFSHGLCIVLLAVELGPMRIQLISTEDHGEEPEEGASEEGEDAASEGSGNSESSD